MVDRIERYLGRLEAELEGRVDGVRLSEILDEVEGHLRESEEGWRELGEPDALANRLAVEGFDDKELLGIRVAKNQISEPVGLRSWLTALGIFFCFLDSSRWALLQFFGGTHDNDGFSICWLGDIWLVCIWLVADAFANGCFSFGFIRRLVDV